MSGFEGRPRAFSCASSASAVRVSLSLGGWNNQVEIHSWAQPQTWFWRVSSLWFWIVSKVTNDNDPIFRDTVRLCVTEAWFSKAPTYWGRLWILRYWSMQNIVHTGELPVLMLIPCCKEFISSSHGWHTWCAFINWQRRSPFVNMSFLCREAKSKQTKSQIIKLVAIWEIQSLSFCISTITNLYLKERVLKSLPQTVPQVSQCFLKCI